MGLGYFFPFCPSITEIERWRKRLTLLSFCISSYAIVVEKVSMTDCLTCIHDAWMNLFPAVHSCLHLPIIIRREDIESERGHLMTGRMGEMETQSYFSMYHSYSQREKPCLKAFLNNDSLLSSSEREMTRVHSLDTGKTRLCSCV